MTGARHECQEGGALHRSFSTAFSVWLYRLAIPWALVILVLWLVGATARVAYPYQIDYGEGSQLDAAARYAGGEPIYAHCSGLPYDPELYGPVYPALWGTLYPIAPRRFWPGRLIATLAALMIAAIAAGIVRRTTKEWAPALVAGSCFLAMFPTRFWTGIAKTDTLAVCLALGGFALFTARPRTRWLGTALFVLAFLTKQTMLAAPAAAYGTMLFTRDRREAALHGLAFCAAVGGAIAVLQVTSAGMFWQSTVVQNAHSEWSLRHLFRIMWDIGKSAPVAILVVAAALTVALGRKDSRSLGVYFLLALGTALAAVNPGSGPYYFIEATAVGAILFGLALAWPRASGGRPSLAWSLALAVALLGLGASTVTWQGEARRVYQGLAADRALVATVAAAPGKVLSDNMGALVQAGKTVWLEPYISTQLAQGKEWDQKPIIEMIHHQQFAMIVHSRSRYSNWTREEAKAMSRYYRRSTTIGSYNILLPVRRARQGTSSAVTVGHAPADEHLGARGVQATGSAPPGKGALRSSSIAP